MFRNHPEDLSLTEAQNVSGGNQNVLQIYKKAEFSSQEFLCFYCADCSQSLHQGKLLLPCSLKNWDNGTRYCADQCSFTH